LIESKAKVEELERSKLNTFKETLGQMLEKYLSIDQVVKLGLEYDFMPIDAGVILDPPQDHPDPKTPSEPQKMYFFKEDRYLVYDLQEKKIIEGPKYIQDTTDNEPNWPGMTFDRVDEVLNWEDGKVYFFYGSDYIRFDLKKWKADENYPRRIREHWVGVMFDRIDAAIVLEQKIFFFRNDQYIVYDMVACKTDPGYPKELIGLYIDGWDIPLSSIL